MCRGFSPFWGIVRGRDSNTGSEPLTPAACHHKGAMNRMETLTGDGVKALAMDAIGTTRQSAKGGHIVENMNLRVLAFSFMPKPRINRRRPRSASPNKTPQTRHR